MRKLLVSLTAAFMIAVGTANAQDAFGSTVQLSPDYYAGANFGLTGGRAAFGLHFGISDLITQGVGTRFTVGMAGSAFNIGADVIANLPVQTGDAPLGIYAGAGLGANFADRTNVTLGLFVGGEFRLVAAGFSPGGIFAELGPSFSITGHGTAFYLRTGFNYHF